MTLVIVVNNSDWNVATVANEYFFLRRILCGSISMVLIRLYIYIYIWVRPAIGTSGIFF